MVKILDALAGRNTGRPPVWFMRQAGRYLPEYRALRAEHSLKTLFFTSSLVKEVTLQPLRRFPLDAAILFSDITVIAPALGCELSFAEGPIVVPEIGPEEAKRGFSLDWGPLAPVWQAVGEIKREISVPLLGFCGAPFTVSTYLAGGIEKTLGWLRDKPDSFSKLFAAVEEASLVHLEAQVERGADAVQIFDSWANLLTPEEFQTWSLPFLEKAVQRIGVPILFFMRSLHRVLELLAPLPLGLSLDWETPVASVRKKTKQPLQGNLNPSLLLGPRSLLLQEAEALLASMEGDSSFVFNLGHGIQPGTPVDAIADLVRLVRGAPVPSSLANG